MLTSHAPSGVKMSADDDKQNLPPLKLKNSVSISTNDDCCLENLSTFSEFSGQNLTSKTLLESISQRIGSSNDVQIFNTKYSDQYEAIQNYRFLGIVGQGSFGTVHRALFMPESREVAVKIINFDNFDESIREEVIIFFDRELELLRDLKEKSTFKFTYNLYSGFKIRNCGYIVMELLEGFTLEQLINSEVQLTSQQERFYLACIVVALEELHLNMGCVHRDIKPENLMVVPNGSLLLLDFGCARKLARGQRTSSIIGTCEYFSPGRFKCDYGFEADFWSFGVLAYELATKKLPFTYLGIESSGEEEKFRKLASLFRKKNQIKLEQIDNRDECFQAMIQSLFNALLNPEQKLEGLKIIKQSEYFDEFDWESLRHNKLEPPRVFSQAEVDQIKQASEQAYEDF